MRKLAPNVLLELSQAIDLVHCARSHPALQRLSRLDQELGTAIGIVLELGHNEVVRHAACVMEASIAEVGRMDAFMRAELDRMKASDADAMTCSKDLQYLSIIARKHERLVDALSTYSAGPHDMMWHVANLVGAARSGYALSVVGSDGSRRVIAGPMTVSMQALQGYAHLLGRGGAEA